MNRTVIEYLTHTWNPIAMRCTPVGPGCENCWHLGMANRLASNPKILPDLRPSYAGDREPLLVGERLYEPFSRKKPSVIGVQFMGDLFHDDIEDDTIGKVWKEMAEAWWHTFMVLTKRPGRMETWIMDRWKLSLDAAPYPYPVPNIWLGTSIEDQERADQRIPALLRSPAAAYYVSAEPLLAPIQFNRVDLAHRAIRGIALVIVGGESGPGARPTHPDWVRSIRDQCVKAGVPFYFKGWGDWVPFTQIDRNLLTTFPMEARDCEWVGGGTSYLVGKKKAGHLLDGLEWRDFPDGHSS